MQTVGNLNPSGLAWRWQRFSSRVDDWLNPYFVKELRQCLHSRSMIITFFLALLISVFGSLTLSLANYIEGFSYYFFMTMGVRLMPGISGGIRYRMERFNADDDIVLTTRITLGQIQRSRLAVLIVQNIVIAGVFLPNIFLGMVPIHCSWDCFLAQEGLLLLLGILIGYTLELLLSTSLLKGAVFLASLFFCGQLIWVPIFFLGEINLLNYNIIYYLFLGFAPLLLLAEYFFSLIMLTSYSAGVSNERTSE